MPANNDFGSIADLLSGLLSENGNKTDEENADGKGEEGGTSPFGGIDLDMIMKISEMLSSMNKEDKNTELLLALKPHLRAENQAKVDSAMKLIKMMALLPFLKESGIFNKLF